MIDTLIFGGTFDPVHYGHVILAESILGTLEKDAQIVFIPNKEPPHRSLPIASAKERIDMLNLALQGRPNFFVDDIEIKKWCFVFYPDLEILQKDLWSEFFA